MRLAKGMMLRGLASTLDQSRAEAQLAVMVSNPSADAHEGVAAFLAKRTPKFEAR